MLTGILVNFAGVAFMLRLVILSSRPDAKEEAVCHAAS